MEEIYRRKSIRKFKDKNVPDDMIEKLLRAAMQAPSATNQQPWEFIIVRDREKLELMSETASPHPYSYAVKNAPVTILLVANMEGLSTPEAWQQDMAAAAENILLEAVHLDLGAVWLGVAAIGNRMEYIRSIFDLEGSINPFAMIPVGYPLNENYEGTDRFDDGRIHYDKW